MPESTINTILDYVWVPIVTGLVMLWSRLAGINVRTRLLEQACESSTEHYNSRRSEDLALRDQQRKEILETIADYHKTIMNKLDRLEREVKNGHG